LVCYEVSQDIEFFTGISQFSDIKFKSGFEIIVSPFTVSSFLVYRTKRWIAKILISQIHPNLFLPPIFVQKFKFL